MSDETMDFFDLYQIYPNRNSELRQLARSAFEFGRTIAKEASAALPNGLDEHALIRQRSFLDDMIARVDAAAAKPLPDLPGSHPTGFPINLSKPYVWFKTDVAGEEVPLNEATTLLAEQWMIFAVELARSASASIAGSLVKFDHERAINNLGVIKKLLDEAEARPTLDLAETSEPGSTYGEVGK